MEPPRKWIRPTASEILSRLRADETILRSESMLNTRKPIGRWSSKFLCFYQDGVGFFLPSNSAKVRHLDLYENCLTFNFSPTDRNNRAKLQKAEDVKKHPLLDYPVVEDQWSRVSVPEMLEARMYSVFRNRLNHELVNMGIKQLLGQWNVKALAHICNFVLDRHSSNGVVLCRFCRYIVDVMMLHDYQNSDLIMRVFKAMCLEFGNCNISIIVTLSPNKIRFFVWHLKRAKDYLLYVKEPWYEAQDPVFRSIVHGDTEELKKFFCLKYPSFIYPLAVQKVNTWPRKKSAEQVPLRSFYSLEYYCYFVDRIIHMILLYRVWAQKSDFKKAFQMLWRAIPTPYLPLSDMHQNIQTSNRVFDKRTWAMVTDLFSEDFPHQYKPRSLLHLSRCAVRRMCSCPELIGGLPVPESLKDYLMLEETAAVNPSANIVKCLFQDIDYDSLWSTFGP